MKIIIKAKDIKLNLALRAWIREKLNSLERFAKVFQNEEEYFFKNRKPKVEMRLEVGRTTMHHRKGQIYQAEAQLRFPKKSLRAVASSENLRVAINMVRDELQRQFKKYKGEKVARMKRGAREFKRSVCFDPSARLRTKKGGRVRDEGA